MSTLTAAQVAEQEAALVLSSFTLDDAVGLGAIAQSRAESENLPLIIQVRHGRRIAFMVSLPGSQYDSENWINRKAAVVEKFETSTMYQKLRYAEKGTTFAEGTGLSPHEFAAYGGGMPIWVANVGIVGSIYASGLPDVEDHEFLVDCLHELRAAQSL
ncbi:MAG: heme-degrading domain-containing protein [Candidatus Nanopelagicales bacterium]